LNETRSLADIIEGKPRNEQAGLVLDFLIDKISDVLAHDRPDAILAKDDFMDMGFSSLTTMQLRDQITNGSGIPLPVTAIYDLQTPADLADYLLQRLTDPTAPDSAFDRDLIGSLALPKVLLRVGSYT
jgi:acyl carrier protein